MEKLPLFHEIWCYKLALYKQMSVKSASSFQRVGVDIQLKGYKLIIIKTS